MLLTLVALAVLCLLALVLFLCTLLASRTLLSTQFRYSGRRISRIVGRTHYILNSSWIPLLVLLIATIVGVWVADSIHLQRYPKDTPWFQLWNVLALYTLLWLILWAWQARKRLVVEVFVDYTGEQSKADMRGLATLLVVKLGQLHDLYRAVDEQRAVPTSVMVNESIDATIEVGDIGEFLKDSVSVQSKLSLGPLEIPLGTLMSLIGRLVQGPRIIGSLHKDNDLVVLAAQYIGGKKSFRWRVDYSISHGAAPDQNVYSFVEMVEELACRMFTDLALNTTVRWKAAAKFSEGLRAYRECLRTPKDRILNLKEAEKKFLEALAEDDRFDLAYYNLGVVYTELDRPDAAGIAFEEAIAQNPNSWAAYYALAMNRYEGAENERKKAMPAKMVRAAESENEKKLNASAEAKYDSIIHLCKRVITLKPGMANLAKANQLRGLAHFRLYQLALASQEDYTHTQKAQQSKKLTLHRNYLNDCRKSRKTAVNQSWLSLCFGELIEQGTGATEKSRILQRETLASICLADLAKIYREGAKYYQSSAKYGKSESELRRAETLYKQALFLNRCDASYYACFHFELGETYSLLERYDDAASEYRTAARIIPNRPDYWAKAASAYARVYASDINKNETKKISVLRACELALTRISLTNALEARNSPEQKALAILEETFEEETFKKLDSVDVDLRLKDEHRCITRMKDFLKQAYEVEEEIKDCKSSISSLKRKRATHDPDKQQDGAWAYARFSLALVDRYCKAHQEDSAKRYFEEAIGKLKKKRRQYTDEDWPSGHFFQVLGLLYLSLDIDNYYGVAEDCFRKAIERFEGKHTLEIRMKRLRASLASALLKQGKHDEALQELEKAIVDDSLSYIEHEALGDVYFERNEFTQAINAWKEALSRRNASMQNPYNPEIHFKIGNSYVKLAQNRREISRKNQENQQAIQHLEQALNLYQGDQQREKLKVFYSLGYFYFALCEYEKAIECLSISQKFSFAQVTSTFYLGYACLRNGNYDECILHFRNLHVCTQKYAENLKRQGTKFVLMKNKLLQTIVEEESIGHISLGEMLALSYWGQAFACAERHVNLDEALNLINKAINQIDSAFGKEDVISAQFPAKYSDCKGWILYKQGKFDEAIKCLEYAVTLTAHAEIYLHLALSYEGKLNKVTNKVEILALIGQARTCCQQAKELSINGQCDQDVDHLLQRLEKKSQDIQLKNPLLFWK